MINHTRAHTYIHTIVPPLALKVRLWSRCKEKETTAGPHFRAANKDGWKWAQQELRHPTQRGGHGLARHSGTCDWRFSWTGRVFGAGVTKAGCFIHVSETCRRWFEDAFMQRKHRWNKWIRRLQKAEPGLGRSKHLWSLFITITLTTVATLINLLKCDDPNIYIFSNSWGDKIVET